MVGEDPVNTLLKTATGLGLSILCVSGMTWTTTATAQSGETETADPSGTVLEGGLEITTAPLPDELQTLIETQIEAANAQDLNTLMATYSDSFEHQDGLDREEVAETLTQQWEFYEDLSYEATIKSWDSVGPDLEAVIVTDIEGIQSSPRGNFKMMGTQVVRNRYRVTDRNSGELQLISQEVLEESAALTSGSEPPTVQMILPRTVSPGSSYRLEAIVEEPLTKNVLLGAVLDESVELDHYLDEQSFQLEQLQAGGIFRQADAPDDTGASWVSVMFVSPGGITLQSQRVTVTNRIILDP